MLFGAALAGCETAIEPAGPYAGAAVVLPDGMVPFTVREAAWTPGDALPVLCEPAAAGVVLPDRLLATGTASHLGVVNSVVLGESCAVDLGTGTVTMGGTAVHTAANGDQLFATWTGTLVGPALTLNITFTGGTGRFEGATGSAVGPGSMDPATGRAEWQASGRITPPGR